MISNYISTAHVMSIIDGIYTRSFSNIIMVCLIARLIVVLNINSFIQASHNYGIRQF